MTVAGENPPDFMRALRPVTSNAQVIDYQRRHSEVTGQGRGEAARLLWMAPLLGPLPAPSSRGEEEKAWPQIFVENAGTFGIVVQGTQ